MTGLHVTPRRFARLDLQQPGPQALVGFKRLHYRAVSRRTFRVSRSSVVLLKDRVMNYGSCHLEELCVCRDRGSIKASANGRTQPENQKRTPGTQTAYGTLAKEPGDASTIVGIAMHNHFPILRECGLLCALQGSFRRAAAERVVRIKRLG